MKKSTLIISILGTIGGLIFALGMCMCLLPEWNAFTGGATMAIIGAIVLLAIYPVYRKDHPKKDKKKPLDKGVLASVIIGIVSALILGVGMSLVMTNKEQMMLGVAIGIIGLIGCILNYPVYQYLKDNRKK